MPHKHALLVVIPTLNEARHIARVIADLSAAPRVDANMLFVVADGGSTDGTQAIVEGIAAGRDDLQLLHNPRKLQSAAINLAVERYGDGRDLLIRCDAHADYPVGFIKNLVDAYDRGEADAIVVPMDSVGATCFQRAVGWVSDSKVGSGGSAHRGGAVSGYVDHGHHALFRMDSFRAAGGYDPSFTHNEDAELDCRQRALGSRIFLDAAIRLRYAPRATPRKLARQYFNYGKGRSRTVRRHRGSLRARQLAVPFLVIGTLAALLLSYVTPIFLLLPALYLAILGTTAVRIAIDQRSACGLLAAPAAAIMHFAWGSGFLWGCATLAERPWTPDASVGGLS
ncbi:glycosyltransferase family 2 protein [Sphingomonas montanisoli]|uniref:Glycosyltransferase family 2 protein n=1 Tax=Sphingomonas montanisoli TaxID=2606412 RepID=A0A5D9C302_9SPHN|nr:glycosyltransferase family 2 protein [Sphingomonas montanisoli]TZG25833.1 glycosyltransferase family 2 protein [Sphingomonas montanisoli]